MDWLFPPVCGGCNRAGFCWCPDCRQQVQIVPEPVCDTLLPLKAAQFLGLSQAISAVSKRLRMTRASVSYDTFRLRHSWRISIVPMQSTRKVFQGGSFAAPTRNLFVCEGTKAIIAHLFYLSNGGGLKPTIRPPYPLPLKQHGLRQPPICQTCGLPLSRPGQCPSCKESIPPYKMLRSWLVFEGLIRSALHNLKYRRNMALGDALAGPLAEHVCTLSWPVDLVVPIPLGKLKEKERSYNQIGLVAMPLAVVNQWRYAPRALARSRETRPQVGLTVTERKLNVSGAFRAEAALVSGATILLIDDVATTGATLSACTKALLDAGAKSVYALTLARALPHHGLNNV